MDNAIRAAGTVFADLLDVSACGGGSAVESTVGGQSSE